MESIEKLVDMIWHNENIPRKIGWKTDYVAHLIVAKKMIQDRMKNSSNPYNFSYDLVNLQSLDIMDYLTDTDDGSHFMGGQSAMDSLYGYLGLMPGASWWYCLTSHFHNTKQVQQYKTKVENNYFYDMHAKLGDSPLTLKQVLDRINQAIYNQDMVNNPL